MVEPVNPGAAVDNIPDKEVAFRRTRKHAGVFVTVDLRRVDIGRESADMGGVDGQ